jgi:aminoglycoside phosphotransferase (APT) family kinase protein
VFDSLWMLWQRPVLLADTTAQLHSVDIEPLMLVGDDESDFDWYAYQLDLAARLQGSASGKLMDWLQANRPVESEVVVSHGDLHPGNVVIGPDGPIVIDWGIATLGPAARDVACTMFALENTGSLAPPRVRPAARLAGRTLSGRFLRRYREASPGTLSDDELNWHRVLYAAGRIYWAARGDQRGRPANEDDELAKRASRYGVTALAKELPLHRKLIKRVTGVDVDEQLVAGLVFPD